MIKITLWGNPVNPACRPRTSNIPPPLVGFFKNLDFLPLTRVSADLFYLDIQIINLPLLA